MAQSRAATVEEYLSELPSERREVVAEVRQMVLEHLPEGYVESMRWGMITYEVPLEHYPTTYNGQPLGYAALAAQKNYYALYLMGAYQDPDQVRTLEAAFHAEGKKMDMGKSCLRFRRLEDLPLEAVGRIIASTPREAFITAYEASRK